MPPHQENEPPHRHHQDGVQQTNSTPMDVISVDDPNHDILSENLLPSEGTQLCKSRKCPQISIPQLTPESPTPPENKSKHSADIMFVCALPSYLHHL